MKPEERSKPSALHLPPTSGGRRVLLIEDEPRLRDMLVRAVTGMGFQCGSVGSAEAALRRMEQDPADIILLDLNLPGMDGMELFETLRRRHADLQVIVLTGFGDLTQAKRAIHLDVVDFLTKPCALGDLEIALERARSRYMKAALAFEPEPDSDDESDLPPKREPPPPPPVDLLEDIERNHILGVLARHHGNRADTAAELGISLRTLYYRLGQYHRQGKLS